MPLGPGPTLSRLGGGIGSVPEPLGVYAPEYDVEVLTAPQEGPKGLPLPSAALAWRRHLSRQAGCVFSAQPTAPMGLC